MVSTVLVAFGLEVSAPEAALAWCGGILAVSVLLSTVLFRRRTS